MMLIKWKRFAVSIGGFAFLIVFIFNLRVNLFWTSFIRGITVFIIFFILGLIIHILFYFNLVNNAHKGTNIDLESGNNDDLNFNDIYNTSNDGEFKPLEFNEIKSNNLNK